MLRTFAEKQGISQSVFYFADCCMLNVLTILINRRVWAIVSFETVLHDPL